MRGTTLATRRARRRSSARWAAAGVAIAIVAAFAPATAHAASVEHSLVVSADPVDWTPHVLDGEVDAVAQVGNLMVIGGTFTQVQDASGGTTYVRPYLAAFDAATGAVDTAFAPTLDGVVSALGVAGT